MRRVDWIVFTVFVFAMGCAPTPKPILASAPDGMYQLDKSHASVVFRVGHLNGLSRYVGRFDEFDAALDFDQANPEASRLEARLEAASINTGLEGFDEQLANDRNLFDARNHPQISFVSTSVTMTGDTTAIVTGDLSFRGVTRPIELDVVFNGVTRDPLRGGRNVVGFSATSTLKRSHWDADAFVNFGVDDDVEVLIEAEFIRQ